MRVAIVGTGYVGLTTGLVLGYLGHRVTCLDVDARKIEALAGGAVPFFEPHLGDLLKAAHAAGAVSFQAGYEPVAGAEVVILAVNTPAGPRGFPDMTYLDRAVSGIGEVLARRPSSLLRQVVVNKSTVPIGTGNYVASRLEEAGLGGFAVASNPEFLAEGSAVRDSLYPDRVVIGSDGPSALEVLTALYRPILRQDFTPPPGCARPVGYKGPRLVTTDLVTAEVIKYASNAFLAARVSLINEFANICRLTGADIRDVEAAVGLDQRIGPLFLRAGVGWGGSCFGKDLLAMRSIAREYGYEAKMLEAAYALNYDQRRHVLDLLRGKLKVLRGRRVALLGLAFKPDTDDLRDAPAITIIESLLEAGSLVRVYDPAAVENARRHLAKEAGVRFFTDPYSCAKGADAVVLLTEWQEFLALEPERLAAGVHRKIMVDGRNFLDGDRWRKDGWDYAGFGIPDGGDVGEPGNAMARRFAGGPAGAEEASAARLEAAAAAEGGR